jgi:beta-lactamase regulating signal transducer with metallopeptidase domain
MNDLGLTMAWLAVQVSLVLVPALVLYAMAARRSPAAGASVAAMSLGLVVALTVAAFLPGIGRGHPVEPVRVAEMSPAPAAPVGAPIATDRAAPSRQPGARGPFADWRVAWARIERGAAEPAERVRPWGRALAVVVLAGIAIGSIRLVLGLAAVVACRRRGRPVDDAGMVGLLDELSEAIGCRAAIDLCEVPDLAGPATAGWLRPVILLPDDWRSWDDSERRAVLAHELAHIVRGDYAAGLVARLALALHGYHPMVHWLAGQLRLQQELAADAIGATHAGGRTGYLVALSRLALIQDGRSPCWPARAFLPARGTLIRRIRMLRNETRTEGFERPWTRARRLAMTAFLLAVTAAVMTLRGPARGGEDGAPTAVEPKAGAPATPAEIASKPPFYALDGVHGVIAIRPAAAARYAAVSRFVPLVDDILGFDLSDIAKQLHLDRTRPGFVRLDIDNLEWITFGVRFGQTTWKGEKRGTIMFSNPAFRTVKPFDWLAFLRQWRFEFVEVREGGSVFYKIAGPLTDALGPDSCVYLPDDRTIVFDQQKVVRKLAGGQVPSLPALLRGPDWERACRGVVAAALSNDGGALAKTLDLGRPDDAVAVSLLKGVDHWTFSVDDADSVALRATAACAGGNASDLLARTVDALVKQGRNSIEIAAREVSSEPGHERAFRMVRALVAHARVEHTDHSVGVHTDGFGTLTDFAAMVEEEVRSAEKPQKPKETPKAAKP